MKIGVIAVGIFAVCLLCCNNASQVKFTNFVCKSYNESLAVFHECRLRAISRNKTTLNLNGTLLHPVNRIRLAAQLFKRENGYKPWLYHFEIDACRFLKKPFNPFVLILYKMLRSYSNINHTCPFVGPQIIKGLHLQYEMFELPWPSGDFLLDADFIYNNKLTVNVKFYARIDE